MSLIDIPMPKNEKNVTRSFDGPALKVHKIQYTIGTDGYQKTAHIIGENYPAAEKLLVESLPDDTKFHIITMADSILEIVGLTPQIEKELFEALSKKYSTVKKPKLSDRFRGK